MSGPRLAAPVDPGAARAEARHILSGRQFRGSPTPRPFRKPLTWLGDRFAGIGHWFQRVLGHVPALLWIGIGVAAVVLAVVFAGGRARAARSRAEARHRETAADGATESPVELERAAAEAEASGDLDLAVRLRFRAGLLRLGDRGAIRYRPSLTTGEVRRALGSATFDELARTFEEVAYGGRGARPPDVDAARRAWPEVVGAARRAPGSPRS